MGVPTHARGQGVAGPSLMRGQGVAGPSGLADSYGNVLNSQDNAWPEED